MKAPWPLVFTRKWIPDREAKQQKMPGVGETKREGEGDTQGIWSPPRRANPPGSDRDLGAGQVRKRGNKRMQETEDDAGTRHGAQR